VYTGNVRDQTGGNTNCVGCGTRLAGRDFYELTDWNLTDDGHCIACGAACPCLFRRPRPLGQSSAPAR